MIDKTYCPRRKQGLVQKNLQDGCVIQDKDQEQLYTLNVTAALVWEYCDGNHSIEKIAREIGSVCSVKSGEVFDGVLHIIADFQQKDLLASPSG
ncbi:MAG: PqqD family protein [Spirochaetota bacterium]